MKTTTMLTTKHRTTYRSLVSFTPTLRTMATATPTPKGPFRLVTVNPQPERAENVVSKVIARLQDQYTIIHAGNIDGMFANTFNDTGNDCF